MLKKLITSKLITTFCKNVSESSTVLGKETFKRLFDMPYLDFFSVFFQYFFYYL